jgi:hypothetical protein
MVPHAQPLRRIASRDRGRVQVRLCPCIRRRRKERNKETDSPTSHGPAGLQLGVLHVRERKLRKEHVIYVQTLVREAYEHPDAGEVEALMNKVEEVKRSHACTCGLPGLKTEKATIV